MNGNDVRKMLEDCHDVNNQKQFINSRIEQLKKEIPTAGDFGRSEIINMFTQILISISNDINAESFTAELLRKMSEWRIICRNYTYNVDNNNRKLAKADLIKLKKIGNEIDILVSVKLGQVEDKK